MVCKDTSTVFTTVVPAIGCAICFLMFLSPVSRVLRARREQTLGDLDPLPFPVMIVNCAGWIGYSFIKQDIFVFIANEPGLILGIFLTMSTFGITKNEKVKTMMTAILIFFTMVLTLLGFWSAKTDVDESAKHLAWGLTTNAILLVYYGIPLLGVVRVIQTRCSGPLVWQTSMMGILNGIVWMAYGLHLDMPFVWMPNAAGILLANLQLTLCLAYPRVRAEVVTVAGMSTPLLVEGTIADVEDAMTALEKVGISTRQHIINIQAHGEVL